MSYIVRQETPQIIERDKAQTLSLVVYDEDGETVTPTAGTFSLYHGQVALVTARAVTAGATNTVALLAADTEDQEYTEDLTETWTLTISGVSQTFSRTGYLVRRRWWPVITDSDLTDLHTILSQDGIRPSELTSYKKYRNTARDRLIRHLIRDGHNPHLMHDAWAFKDALTFLSLHLIFTDFRASTREGAIWKELAEEYGKKWEAEYQAAQSRYDYDGDGTVSPDETPESSGGPIVLSSGNPHAWRWG